MLDGWWLEGHIEGATGWSIGAPEAPSSGDARDAAEIYQKLETEILPLYQDRRDPWSDVMRQCISPDPFRGAEANDPEAPSPHPSPPHVVTRSPWRAYRRVPTSSHGWVVKCGGS